MADYKDLLSTFNLVAPVQKGVERPNSGVKGSKPINGIIFTDTTILANKFSINQEYIISKLSAYISQCEVLGIRYVLLDMAENMNASHIINGKSWYCYHKALYSFIDRNHIEKNSSTSVFIIGGDDVIAVPQHVFNLGYDEDGFKVEIDLWYCFQYGFDINNFVCNEYANGNYNPTRVEQKLLSLANLNVSRLPLTNGSQHNSFESTVVGYLDRSLKTKMKVEAQSGMMVTASQWLNESAFVAENLPLQSLGEDSDYVYKGIYRSPYIDVDDTNSMVSYKATLNHTDFLLFNLHGDVVPTNAGYYGSPLTPSSDGPCAFNIPLLKHCKARMLNTMACWGARYIGYNTDNSILLSAIYSSFLSFVGASNIALGKHGEYPCGCSETLLKIFTERFLCGESVGESLLKSKVHYITHFSMIDGFVPAYYTICEFNLFGSPLISYMSCDHKFMCSSLDTYARYRNYNHLSSLDEAYERVRNLVDDGLDEITYRLSQLLSGKYGYRDVNVSRINRVMSSSVHVGYDFIFTYDWGRMGYISVRTDKQGNPSAIYYTK